MPYPGRREKDMLYAPHGEPPEWASGSLKPKNEGPADDLAAEAPELDLEDISFRTGISQAELDGEAGL